MQAGWTSELEWREGEAGYFEVQSKQRTAYLCRDLVRPLTVSLSDRIPPLAAVALASREENQWQKLSLCSGSVLTSSRGGSR